MTEIAWETAHSVEANASLNFVWKYWKDPLPWFVRDVRPMSGATIEMQVEGATIWFQWQFASLAEERTKLTQRILLTAEEAGTHLEQAKSMFTANLPTGMNKLAVALANAFSTGKTSEGNASS